MVTSQMSGGLEEGAGGVSVRSHPLARVMDAGWMSGGLGMRVLWGKSEGCLGV